MKHRRINDNCDHISRSSSPTNSDRGPKCPKLNQSTSASLDTSGNESAFGTVWELERVKRELVTLRAKLSLTEETVTQHHKLRKQSEELFEKEKNILQAQAQVDKETIKQLQEDLDISIRNTHEAREAQAAAEAELSQLKTNMEQQIRELLNTDTKTQEDFELHNIPARITIERINPEERGCGTKGLVENNLQRNGDYLSKEPEQQEGVVTKDKSGGSDIPLIENPMAKPDTQISSAKTSHGKVLFPDPSVYKGFPSKKTDKNDLFSDEYSSDPAYDELLSDSSAEGPELNFPTSQWKLDNLEKAMERKGRVLRIGHICILVSSGKYFKLNWKVREYYQEEPGEWVCRKCPQTFKSKQAIKDHIWVKHYEGKFECPHCLPSQTRRAGRYRITKHIRKKHPDQYHRSFSDLTRALES